jgi:signal transduction histidine kinase
MEQLVERFGQKNGLKATWTLNGEPFVLIPAQANALYRIAEEALDNIERHAGASHIAVQLDYDTGVTVRVSDDGRGFDPDQVDADRFGLLGIYERCELIEATASVDSSPGQGTVLTVHIAEPWKE